MLIAILMDCTDSEQNMTSFLICQLVSLSVLSLFYSIKGKFLKTSDVPQEIEINPREVAHGELVENRQGFVKCGCKVQTLSFRFERLYMGQ